MEILDKSSRWRRRHAPRTSFFVCIRTLKSRSAPWLTFTGSGGFSLLFSVAVFAVSRRANVTELDNPSAAFFFFPRVERGAEWTAAAAHLSHCQHTERAAGSKVRAPQHQNTQQHLPLDTDRRNPFTHGALEWWLNLYNNNKSTPKNTDFKFRIMLSLFFVGFCLYLQSSHKIKTFHCVLTCQNVLNTYKLLFCFHTLESAHACAEL